MPQGTPAEPRGPGGHPGAGRPHRPKMGPGSGRAGVHRSGPLCGGSPRRWGQTPRRIVLCGRCCWHLAAAWRRSGARASLPFPLVTAVFVSLPRMREGLCWMPASCWLWWHSSRWRTVRGRWAVPSGSSAAVDLVAAGYGGTVLRLDRGGEQARALYAAQPWLWSGPAAAARICVRMGLSGQKLESLISKTPRFHAWRREVPVRSDQTEVLRALPGKIRGGNWERD